jgi:MFS family permease
MTSVEVAARPLLARLDDALGGPARRRVVVLLALVLALDAADKATIGAVAAELQRNLGITNLQLGVLAAASLGVAGLATVPAGIVADRLRRTWLLAGAVVLWSGTLIVAGAAGSFTMLLVSRLALGALTATAGPTLASLVGDYFPTHERGRFFAYILTGEIIGAGFGFIVAGEITAVLSWRWGFWVLVLPGVALARAILKGLPEPKRGGASRIPEGAECIPEDGFEQPAGDDGGEQLTVAQEVAQEEHVDPDPSLVLEEDPTEMAAPDAIRYVLRVPTNRVLIVASALGWFFFAGVRTFGVIFIRAQFGVGQAAATALLAVIGVGGLIGVLLGGRISDALIRRGRLSGRVLVAFTGYALTPVLLAPGIASQNLWVSLPLLFAGTMALGAANPPVDAGRLDVMHHRLWGRADAVRTAARSWAEAAAPIAFGGVSQLLSGGNASPFATQGGAAARHAASESASGIKWTFLIMLVPLMVGALVGLRARRTYPRDVATAARSEESAPVD